MSKSKTTRPIDGKALMEEIRSRTGLTASGISEAMGYSRNYIGVACHNGRLSQSTVMVLEKVYGIKPESYLLAYGEEVKDPPISKEVTDRIEHQILELIRVDKRIEATLDTHIVTLQGLEKVVYQAVKQAMVEALSGEK